VTVERERGQFKDGRKEGSWASYWSNGQLWMRGRYKDGVLDGPVVAHHKNGQLKEQVTGTYKDGVKID